MQTLSSLLEHKHLVELLTAKLISSLEDRYVPSKLESLESYRKRRKLAIQESLRRTLAQADVGFLALTKHIKIDMPTLSSFNPQKPFQLYECFGWTKETLRTFYEGAKKFLDEKEYANAIDAFSFLVTIAPKMAEFWKALSVAYKSDGKVHEASEAYQIALYLEGTNGTP